MALNGLFCADVLLTNYSLTPSFCTVNKDYQSFNGSLPESLSACGRVVF